MGVFYEEHNSAQYAINNKLKTSPKKILKESNVRLVL